MKKYRHRATEDQKQALLELFYTEQDNSVSRISGMCNLTEAQADRIIDKELRGKKNSNNETRT